MYLDPDVQAFRDLELDTEVGPRFSALGFEVSPSVRLDPQAIRAEESLSRERDAGGVEKCLAAVTGFASKLIQQAHQIAFNSFPIMSSTSPIPSLGSTRLAGSRASQRWTCPREIFCPVISDNFPASTVGNPRISAARSIKGCSRMSANSFGLILFINIVEAAASKLDIFWLSRHPAGWTTGTILRTP